MSVFASKSVFLRIFFTRSFHAPGSSRAAAAAWKETEPARPSSAAAPRRRRHRHGWLAGRDVDGILVADELPRILVELAAVREKKTRGLHAGSSTSLLGGGS